MEAFLAAVKIFDTNIGNFMLIVKQSIGSIDSIGSIVWHCPPP